MIKALAFAAALNICGAGNPDLNEMKALESLDEVKNLQIIGDFVTIVSKNTTGDANTTGLDAFDEYLRSHVIRIRDPFAREKYFNFELKNFFPEEMAEGRKKKRMGLRDILVPLLLAIKHKATVLSVLMMFVTILALKGFWAGMTGLFISKLVGVKVFLQSQNDDHDEDHDENREHGDHQEDEEGHEENEEPIVINLQPHGGKFSRRRHEPHLVRHYYDPKRWNPWGRQRVLGKTKWKKSIENWEEKSLRHQF